MSLTSTPSHPADCDGSAAAASFHLPMELLNLVLGMLDRWDLVRLLHVSRVMAQLVMQHKSGKLELTLDLSNSKANVAAVRQLLQWAPSEGLKLELHGIRGRHSGWPACGVFDTPVPGQQTQQYPSILEIRLSNFTLPGLVPASLAAACPNLHTLHLSYCSLEDSVIWPSSSSSSSVQADARATSISTVTSTSIRPSAQTSLHPSSSGNSESVAWPAKQLRTLTITGVLASHLQCLLPAANSGLQRTTSQSDGYVRWLRCTTSHVTCLRLNEWLGSYSDEDKYFIALLGPQLRELHIPSLPAMTRLLSKEVVSMLQLLQLLMLPQTEISLAADIELLLSLPNLTHVELHSVKDLATDYSTHNCKWQYLKLHLDCRTPLCLDSLTKLPLQSLTQPVVLGDAYQHITVRVPPPGTQGSSTLSAVLIKLLKPGVQLLASGILWHGRQPLPAGVPQGAEIVPALKQASFLFGQLTHVGLSHVVVDQEVVQALASLYQTGVNRFTLNDVTFSADLLPTWRTALSAWPSLTKVKIYGWWSQEEMAGLVQAVRCLAAAMAQQPAGRYIKVMIREEHCHDTDELARLVLDGAEQQLVGVRLTAEPDDYDQMDFEHETRFLFTACPAPLPHVLLSSSQ